jgi:hypothetical protein
MDTNNMDKIEQGNTTPTTEIVPDMASILTALLRSTERQSYRLIVHDGRLVELTRISGEVKDRSSEMQAGWVSMRTAAKRLAHSYTWMSRSWRELGLHPRRMGSVLFFPEAEIAGVIERQRPLGIRRGRPRKIIGIIRS